MNQDKFSQQTTHLQYLQTRRLHQDQGRNSMSCLKLEIDSMFSPFFYSFISEFRTARPCRRRDDIPRRATQSAPKLHRNVTETGALFSWSAVSSLKTLCYRQAPKWRRILFWIFTTVCCGNPMLNCWRKGNGWMIKLLGSCLSKGCQVFSQNEMFNSDQFWLNSTIISSLNIKSFLLQIFWIWTVYWIGRCAFCKSRCSSMY